MRKFINAYDMALKRQGAMIKPLLLIPYDWHEILDTRDHDHDSAIILPMRILTQWFEEPRDGTTL